MTDIQRPMMFDAYAGRYVGCNPIEVGKAAETRIAELEDALRFADSVTPKRDRYGNATITISSSEWEMIVKVMRAKNS